MSDSLEERFAHTMTVSGIMTAEEADAVLAGRTVSEPIDVAKLSQSLVNDKRLTPFQAELVSAGKPEDIVLGDYLILDKLGAGGMGMVYKAQHRRMRRIVALKVLPPAVTRSIDKVQRFAREVVVAAKLSHRNIVTAFDAREDQGIHFLVMEYVEGTDLAALVKKGGPVSVDRAVNFVMQTARGLQYAHSQGVVHRDIKPHNLLLDNDGTVKILDMGLARFGAVDRDEEDKATKASLTQAGSMMGTVDFMSPEQALDTRQADHRSDIYSLGCTLYYLLTGKCEYSGDTVMKKLLAHREQPIPNLIQVVPSASSKLDRIHQKMLAKNPSDRYQSMQDVIRDLERLNRDEEPPELEIEAEDSQTDCDSDPGRSTPKQAAREPNLEKPSRPTESLSASNYRDAVAKTKSGEKSPPGSKTPASTKAEAAADTKSSASLEEPDSAEKLKRFAEKSSARERSKDSRTLARLHPEEAEAAPANSKKMPLLMIGSVVAAVLVTAAIAGFMVRQKPNSMDVAGPAIDTDDAPTAIVKKELGKRRPSPVDGLRPKMAEMPAITKVENADAPALATKPEATAKEDADKKEDAAAIASAAPAAAVREMTAIKGGSASPRTMAPREKIATNIATKLETRPPEPQVVSAPTATNSLGMQFVQIPAGEFMMGSPDGDADAQKNEKPRHSVVISRPFNLGVHPVRVRDFRAFVDAMGYQTDAERDGKGGHGLVRGKPVQQANFNWRDTGFPMTDDHPVVNVSWRDANIFMTWLAEREGGSYRLPTEAEREYACRAGYEGKWSFGDNPNDLRDYAWYADNSGGVPHPVGQKRPNSFGLFDMHGNVWEWCADWYAEDFYDQSDRKDPTGPSWGKQRVLRGGSFLLAPSLVRSADRFWYPPNSRHLFVGFRIIRG